MEVRATCLWYSVGAWHCCVGLVNSLLQKYKFEFQSPVGIHHIHMRVLPLKMICCGHLGKIFLTHVDIIVGEEHDICVSVVFLLCYSCVSYRKFIQEEGITRKMKARRLQPRGATRKRCDRGRNMRKPSSGSITATLNSSAACLKKCDVMWWVVILHSW